MKRNSRLEQFYLGNNIPVGRHMSRNKNSKKYAAMEKEFVELLDDEDLKQHFFELINTLTGLQGDMEDDAYIEGFKRGVQMMCEVFADARWADEDEEA